MKSKVGFKLKDLKLISQLLKKSSWGIFFYYRLIKVIVHYECMKGEPSAGAKRDKMALLGFPVRR